MKQVSLLDICLPDYFAGYGKPVVSVALYGTVTCDEVAELIEEELNASYDYINPENDANIDELYNNYCAELRKNGSDLFYKSEFEEDTEEAEPAYAYFSIIDPVKVHGLTFLNW